jgi:AraC family transcriptional regulator of adaptative response / DNA-3-methyladenine glycosylase II
MLAHLTARAITGVEKVAQARYSRSFLVGGEAGCVQVAHSPATCSLRITITTPSAHAHTAVLGRLSEMFDLAADLATIGDTLKRDPLLHKLLVKRPGLRVPGAWDAFELAMRAVLGQQVSLQAGRRLTEALVRLCGTQIVQTHRHECAPGWVFPTAAQVAAADLAPLRMPNARKRALLAVALAALDDCHLFESAGNIEATVSKLTAITGIGEWTAHYIAMRAISEADAFPATDAALLRCMTQLQGTRPSAPEFIERARQWRPWRAYAAQHLWTAGAMRTAR